MRGTFKGQLRTIHRDRETRPDRVSDFWEALESGDIQMRGSSINMNWKRLLISASDVPGHRAAS
jgi:hypothetical protein